MPDADLRDDLMDIRGIGDATADEILAVLDGHAGLDADAVDDRLEEALSYYHAGRPEYAMKFVRRARDELRTES